MVREFDFWLPPQLADRSTVYRDYLKAANGFVMVPLVVLTMVLMQAGTLLSQFDLTWWQSNKWNRTGNIEGFYVCGVTPAKFS